MKDPKTTIAAILVAVASLAGVVATFLTTGTLDAATAWQAIIGLLAAVGLWKAADS